MASLNTINHSQSLPQLDTTGSLITALALAVLPFILGIYHASWHMHSPDETRKEPGLLRSIWLFCYSCFLKPHNGDSHGTQQDALESFYQSQASAYDTTRRTLLKGREDMLAVAAAQLKHRQTKAEKGSAAPKPIWVDVSTDTYQRHCRH